MTDYPGDWPRCRPWIEVATHESALADSIETIEAKLATGVYHLAASPNAAVIVEFCRYGERETLIARFGGGNLVEIFEIIEPRLYAIAKSTGRLFMAEGRLGWLRPAKRHGWKLAWITMVKE